MDKDYGLILCVNIRSLNAELCFTVPMELGEVRMFLVQPSLISDFRHQRESSLYAVQRCGAPHGEEGVSLSLAMFGSPECAEGTIFDVEGQTGFSSNV